MPRFDNIIKAISARATPLPDEQDLEPLIAGLGQRKLVMLGEASHGTHEFYTMRAYISRRLIEDHGFQFVAVEGDWPACRMINRFAFGGEVEPFSAMHRWPTWMWVNQEVKEFASWLREHNRDRSIKEKVGLYGLDVYSLFESIAAVLQRLKEVDVNLHKKAEELYSCFAKYQGNEHHYARSLLSLPKGCREEALEVLTRVLAYRIEPSRNIAHDKFFDAQQNARTVKNAEAYYRAMIKGDGTSWNVRDRHMMETLDILMAQANTPKGIVWAHNTHIGDYRATDMAEQGLINIGGLARRHYGARNVSLIGFSTYTGKVVAAHAWEGDVEVMPVPPARSGSYEDAYHQVAQKSCTNNYYTEFREEDRRGSLNEILGHRAIGVVYDPRHELRTNYVPTALASRYDAFIFISYTTALHFIPQDFKAEEMPETWPAGF